MHRIIVGHRPVASTAHEGQARTYGGRGQRNRGSGHSGIKNHRVWSRVAGSKFVGVIPLRHTGDRRASRRQTSPPRGALERIPLHSK